MIKSITTNNRGLLLIMQAKPRLKTDNDFRRLRSCEEKDLALFQCRFLILKINGNEDLEMSKNQEIAARVLKAVGAKATLIVLFTVLHAYVLN